MDLKTIIFFGRSGSGKGTQAKFVIDKLKADDGKRATFYIETGERLRQFAREASPTAKLVAKIMDKGGLLPEFVPIWIWTDHLIKNVSGNEHLVLDGLARRIEEAPVLDSALRFYSRPRPTVVHINVGADWATEKLLARKRLDDNVLDIKQRMDWYDTNVLPTLEYFKSRPDFYNYLDINGEQEIEKVWSDISAKMF